MNPEVREALDGHEDEKDIPDIEEPADRDEDEDEITEGPAPDG